MILKVGEEYGLNDLYEGEIKIENYIGLYGGNKTRNDLRIVEFNGVMVRGVYRMVIECDDTVVFKLYDSIGEIVAEYIMMAYEKFVVKVTSVGTLKYKFINYNL